MIRSGPAEAIRGKIKGIEELAKLLSSARAGKKRIAHCHGVFDLLHIGHIRHLQQAKRLGDLLVVTVTPDRYVNKGPHRPAFPEALRAEALASLDCVDYVAINRWPMASEAIRLLRPQFYVKGPDYKDAGKDRTGGIDREASAVRAAGGKLAFTEDITFSSSSLINRNLSVFPPQTAEYLARFAARRPAADILGYLENAKRLKVLAIGEAIIDEYQYCEAIGKSSKEPMLAMRHLSTEKFPGGILAVGNHLANFCGKVGLLTFLGARNAQEDFIRRKLAANIEKNFLYKSDSPTIVKRRFVENYFFMKLLEIYEMNDSPLGREDNGKFCEALERLLPQYDAAVVVDFGHGILSREAVDILCRKAKFLAVNAQSNAGNLGYHTVSRYARADYVCITEGELRLETRNRQGDLRQMVSEVAKKLKAKRVVVTRGKSGCLCYGEKEGFFEVPAFAGQVIDRMGAGDAFLSLTSLCVAQKAPMEVVGFIGNAAGAQAVATVGNRTPIERVPLFRHIESLLK